VRRRRPPRIGGFNYTGPHAYFLTICAFKRVPWFANHRCASETICELLRTAGDYGFAAIAYCLMPDHLHALLDGTRQDSNFRKCVSMFKQRSAFAHVRRHERPLWQDGYFEHIVRREEAIESIAAYIVANPIRAGLCTAAGEYPYLGSDRYTIDQLREAIQLAPAWK
jgi:REP element-mobilizing transposase RayT